MELLAPCGNYESLEAAIYCGADAVYLGGNMYGARAYADNFSNEEIIRAVSYAHLFGRKVYLTVNTLIKDKEFNAVIQYIKPFYLAGLDACIVQDIGLISYLTKAFPDMEVHASTQCFITGANSAMFFKNLGCNRVVLARELGLFEIKEIKKKTGLEIETFIHGSMCYSYSGDCLYSSSLGGRSGNRGRCAGPCRLDNRICDKNLCSDKGYYLSMKDQCALPILPDIINADVDSLKIEGRMKKPEYTAIVTSIYRKYIDLYLKNPNEFKIENSDLNKLKSIYLRSEIGTGYYNRVKGKEMISVYSPSYNGNDEALMREINDNLLNKSLKKNIDMYFYASFSEPVSLTAVYDDISVTVTGNEASKSINRPTTEDDIKKQLLKLGDTYFTCNDPEIYIGKDLFVPLSEINDLRRRAVAKIMEQLIPERKIYPYIDKYDATMLSVKRKFVVVSTNEQLEASREYKDKFNLVINSDIITPKFNNPGIYIDLPRVLRRNKIEYIKELIGKFDKVSGFICHNLETLMLLKDISNEYEIILGSEIYTWNKKALKALEGFFFCHELPLELNKHELKAVSFDNAIMPVYLRTPLMVTENCVRRTAFGCKGNDDASWVHIKDRKNMDLPVYLSCKNCYNVIYNAVRTSLHEFYKSGDFDELGIEIRFTDEDTEMTKFVLDYYFGEKSEMKDFSSDFTKSYYQKGVE